MSNLFEIPRIYKIKYTKAWGQGSLRKTHIQDFVRELLQKEIVIPKYST